MIGGHIYSQGYPKGTGRLKRLVDLMHQVIWTLELVVLQGRCNSRLIILYRSKLVGIIPCVPSVPSAFVLSVSGIAFRRRWSVHTVRESC